MAKPKKGVMRGKKGAARHRPLGGMAGNAWSRMRERGRNIDSIVEESQRTLQERDMPKD